MSPDRGGWMGDRVNWSYLDGVLAVWIGDGPIAHVGDPEAGIICEALSNLTMRGFWDEVRA